MVILLLSPIACALVTTSILIVTFYSGRWWGMKMTMDPYRKSGELPSHLTRHSFILYRADAAEI